MTKPKILIVDDDANTCDTLMDLLRRDYQVVAANDRDSAIQHLRESLIHLAIVDVRLKNNEDPNDKSGLDLCNEMDPTVPRVILTGYETWTAVRDAMRPLGRRHRAADGFFNKHEDPGTWLATIRAVLQAEYEVLPERRIAVLTSGGDSPGMNAAIWAVVRTAMQGGVEVMAVHDGYRGLVEDDIYKLKWNDVSDIMDRGGTILGTARYKEFGNPQVRERAIENLIRKHISGLVVIGGDGSMRGAQNLARQMAEAGGPTLQTVALPGTIDNDLFGSDMSLGADSAANAMVNEIRNMVRPAQALRRIFVVEVMGRYAGYLALEAALGIGADATLIPEDVVEVDAAVDGTPLEKRVNLTGTLNRLVERLGEVSALMEQAFAARKKYGFVILAEGIGLLTGKEGIADKLQEILADKKLLSGKEGIADIAQKILSHKISQWSHQNRPDVRVQVLGYPVRGVAPSRFDVHLGAKLGESAVRAILAGRSGKMVGWIEGRGIEETDFDKVVEMSNKAPGEIWKDRPKWQDLLELQRALARPPRPVF